MDCVRASELLHGYLDNELDTMHVAEIQAHLGACVSCREEHAQELKLRSLLQARATRYAAPAQLRSQILASVRSAQRGRRLREWVPMGWLQFGGSLAATVLLTSAVTYYSLVSPNSDRVVDEVVATHVRSLITNRLTDVESSDQHTVKPWFNGKVDFSPPVKDLAAQGFPLVGGRLDYIDGRPVAALLYRHRQHWISVFMWPDQSGQDSAPRGFSKRGYDITQWSAEGLRFYVVSDIASPELGQLVTLLRSENIPR
jgi:mycothiol system anti-sigma-R factor